MNKKGFTLIEIMVVIAIIAVLISIAIPVFNGSMKKAANATDAANARNLYGVLATMVNMGEIEFPEKSADPNDLQGVWVLVCRDSNTTPNAYGKLNGTMFCGANSSVSVNGVHSKTWNSENPELRNAIISQVGNLKAQSRGGDDGWDWYVAGFCVDTKGNLSGYMYSGKAGERSDVAHAALKGTSNLQKLIQNGK